MTNSQNPTGWTAAPTASRPRGTHPTTIAPDEAATALLEESHAPLPSVTVTDSPAEVEALALIVASGITSSGDVVVRSSGLADATITTISETLRAMGARGKAEEVVRIPAPAGIAARLVVAAGTGRFEDEVSPDAPAVENGPHEALRDAVAAATRSLSGLVSPGADTETDADTTTGNATIVLAAPADTEAELGSVLTGALLGDYAFTRYTGAKPGRIAAVQVATGLETAVTESVVQETAVLTEAIRAARSFVNTSPRDLTPEVFAAAAQHLATTAGCEVEVLDEQQLAEGGYGAILGVGQGSVHPPRLVRVTWDGTESGDAREIALVGKGITFDSGGLSLKPPASMETMQSDMAGAAAVLQIPLAAAALKLPVRVTAWLALAENMPGADAQRPSDVVVARDGTSIQVLNTDAEGRLVLADALLAAREFAGDRLDLIVDVATLTGAQIIALGDRIAGVMGTPEARARVVEAGDAAGEALWPMPVPTYLRGQLDTPIATIKNKGPRPAGMLTAATFLAHFAGDGPWAHIDIAGPSYNEGSPHGITPTGGTGSSVATLLQLVQTAAHA